MKSLKNRLQLLAAILLLSGLIFMVWYVLFHRPGTGYGPDGTLVLNSIGKLVKL